MADLYHHTDEDGFTVQVRESVEIAGRLVMVASSGPSGREHVTYLDRDAALRLADALLSYYGPEKLSEKEEVDG